MKLTAAMLSLCLTACGGSATEPDVPTIGGPWAGPILTRSELTLFLFELSGEVTGFAVVTEPSAPDVTYEEVTGTHNYPDVHLTLSGAAGYQDVVLTGRMLLASQIRAALYGSGFDGDSIVLAKCPC